MTEPFRPESLLFVYCVFVIIASVTGGQLSKLLRMTHLRTQLLMSGVGGLMLGIAMLHLLPHATEVLQSSSKTGAAALAGLIAMFLLVRLFHTHDHGVVDHVHHEDIEGHDHLHDDCGGHSHAHSHPAAIEHEHEHEHEHGHGHGHGHGPKTKKRFSWAGMFFGLALHTIVDGVALASSVIADASHGAWLGLAGLGTFLAVAMHKPLDAFAITSVMSKQGWSPRAQAIANGTFAVTCPLGALMMYFGATRLGTAYPGSGDAILGWGLAISAGFFICIALADLLPEVAFHDHDRGKLTLALLIGVGIALAIENLPGHRHQDHQGHGHQFPGVMAPSTAPSTNSP
ncbi:ZIP family metal transporter [Neorhodopirellula pilleata]|uniref:Zinc transporter ZupT n=1 Tax=Neorhodopirellula pilleata TaxID=2714738 RepID=A0A5C5ZX12_9BACT|nr:ZIP family metal transporter [Neorhodopirellula pilleata]TWT91666.1 zinc transporter ZupT [Neorhodopirellula pilleata]